MKRTVLGDACAQLLEASLSVPTVHVRLEDDSFAAELTALVAA